MLLCTVQCDCVLHTTTLHYTVFLCSVQYYCENTDKYYAVLLRITRPGNQSGQKPEHERKRREQIPLLIYYTQVFALDLAYTTPLQALVRVCLGVLKAGGIKVWGFQK